MVRVSEVGHRKERIACYSDIFILSVLKLSFKDFINTFSYKLFDLNIFLTVKNI